MSETKPLQTIESVEEDDNAKVVYRAKSFWEHNKKLVIGIPVAIIIIAAAWLGYSKLVAQPKENTANEAIWKAQQYFEKDSLRLALYGDGKAAGFEKIAKTYGGTKAGNLAKYCGGICALRLNEPKKAVDFLKDFSTDSKPLQAIAYARLADAYADLNQNSDAVNFYDKAGHAFTEDQANSAEALFRAGLLSQVSNKTDDAIKYFKEIKEKFPRTERGSRIDEYLASLGNIEAGE